MTLVLVALVVGLVASDLLNLAERMRDDLEIAWRDDRGGEERALHNWEVRATGRTLEFFPAPRPGSARPLPKPSNGVTPE